MKAQHDVERKAGGIQAGAEAVQGQHWSRKSAYEPWPARMDRWARKYEAVYDLRFG